jgi:nitroimidazol reductase NimA-like FMN-containing flavoprotein (pyridoxamine 5'-phosphate oxidase superfamily)
MLREADGKPVCVTIHHTDALILARSGTNYSINYRSVMVLGTARLVTEVAHAEHALEELVESITPGRWAQLRPMTEEERKKTGVMFVDLDEASAKIRAERNMEEPGDEAWPIWGGIVPLRLVRGEPEPDEFVKPGMSAPEVRIP